MGDEARAKYSNAMSVMATIALIRLMSGKRFIRALESNEKIPQNLLDNLSQILTSCSDHTLTVPGSLQAKASSFCQTKS